MKAPNLLRRGALVAVSIGIHAGSETARLLAEYGRLTDFTCMIRRAEGGDRGH